MVVCGIWFLTGWRSDGWMDGCCIVLYCIVLEWDFWKAGMRMLASLLACLRTRPVGSLK